MRRIATVIALTAAIAGGPLASSALADRGHWQPGSCGMGWLADWNIQMSGSIGAGRGDGDPPYGHFVKVVRGELDVIEPCKGKR